MDDVSDGQEEKPISVSESAWVYRWTLSSVGECFCTCRNMCKLCLFWIIQYRIMFHFDCNYCSFYVYFGSVRNICGLMVISLLFSVWTRWMKRGLRVFSTYPVVLFNTAWNCPLTHLSVAAVRMVVVTAPSVPVGSWHWQRQQWSTADTLSVMWTIVWGDTSIQREYEYCSFQYNLATQWDRRVWVM